MVPMSRKPQARQARAGFSISASTVASAIASGRFSSEWDVELTEDRVQE